MFVKIQVHEQHIKDASRQISKHTTNECNGHSLQKPVLNAWPSWRIREHRRFLDERRWRNLSLNDERICMPGWEAGKDLGGADIWSAGSFTMSFLGFQWVMWTGRRSKDRRQIQYLNLLYIRCDTEQKMASSSLWENEQDLKFDFSHGVIEEDEITYVTIVFIFRWETLTSKWDMNTEILSSASQDGFTLVSSSSSIACLDYWKRKGWI